MLARGGRVLLWRRYTNLSDDPQARNCRAVAAVRGRRSGRAASATSAAARELAGSGRLWRTELRAGANGVRTAALLARPGVADHELDADRRATAQRARQVGRPDPSRQRSVGRAYRLRRIFQPADRRAARRRRVFLDGCPISAV